MATKVKITYILHTFNKEQAAAGALCAVVSGGFHDGDSVYTVDTSQGGNAPSEGFYGVGICITSESRYYTVIIDSKKYRFDSNGNWTESTDSDKRCLMIATLGDSVNYSGNVVDSSTTANAVRNRIQGGDIQYEEKTISYGEYTKSIDTLYPRDQFALQALRGMLSHVEHPHTLSDSEINFYCNAAYQWAASMMSAAANARGTLDDRTKTSTTNIVEVGELDSNTDKLLNNLIAELERNDNPVGDDGTWTKAGQNGVIGKYTDAVAATLPPSEGHSAYANIAAAESDGWVWVADKYAESVSFSEMTMKGLEKLARQHRGAHKLSEEDAEDAQDSVIDPDEENITVRFYNMSLYEHNVKKWLKALTKKLASNETRDTLGLYELIEALQRTDYSEVESGSTVYSERVVNPKLNKLLEDLQETISSKKYERVTVYKLEDIIEALGTLNTTLTTGFANIVAALNTFTSNMNTRFADVGSAISNAKTDVINAMPSTSGLATSNDVSSAESAIISAMPSCKYTPPSDNNT